MKTFTRFFALLFAFAIIGSTNLNAQPWSAPSGDGGQPLLELWVYGATLPAGAPEVGDQIAVFDGGTLVGLLTLTEIPSTTTWLDCQIIAYSKTTTGGDLYTPDNPFLIKYYDVSATTTYNAWTWGDGNHIDFHDSWWAPTSDEAGATTEGAFFPSSGASSYGYVDLTFTASAVPTIVDLEVSVFQNNGSTGITTATLTAGGYSGVAQANPNDFKYDMELFAGDFVENGTTNYTYTVTVSAATYTTETFEITVTNGNGGGVSPGAGYTQNVYLDGKGNLTGIVKAYDLNTSSQVVVENALVSTTIDGVAYSDYTDASGVYLISNIPDGTWDFTYSYGTDHVSQTISRTIAYDGSTTDVSGTPTELLLKQGSITGYIYDATTGLLITEDIKVEFKDAGGASLTSITTNSGAYTLPWYGGTYQIVVSDVSGGGVAYDSYTVDDHTIYAEYTESMNFNLLPNGTAAYFSTVSGNANALWSIHIEMAKFGANSLLPWDELAIYDKTQGLLVGSLRLQKAGVYQNSGTNVIKAYAEFSNGSTGFVAGNEIEFKAYDISHSDEYVDPEDWWFNTGVGNYSALVFPDLTTNPNPISYLNIYWGAPSQTLTGVVSSSGGGTVDGVLVEVLNYFTGDVITSTTTAGGGIYSFELEESTYDIKFTKAGFVTKIVDDQVVSGYTTKNVTLTARSSMDMDYTFGAQGYYFIGRAVEQSPDEMLNILDYDGNLTIGDADEFTDNYQSSWVGDDATPVNKLEYTGGNWEPDFSGIDYEWELLEGYQLYLESAYSFDMEGYLVIPENNPITFGAAGIYYIPYFPWSDTPADYDEAIDAFAGIFGQLDWVMDEDGNRLHNDGGGWIDNIGTMDPTKGYKIKMTAAATLTYPGSKKKGAADKKITMDPVHFIFSGGNAADWTYTIHIDTDEFGIGDEIAAYSNGVMVGAMVIDSEDPWENDLNMFNTAINGGYEINSPIELMGWDASTGYEYEIIYEMVQINEGAYIGRNYPAGLDHYSYAEVRRGTVNVDENQIDNNVRVYPNPTSTTLTIESVSNIKEVHVYNLYGALVDVVNVNAAQQTLDVSNYVAGTYMIQLHTDTGVITKRVIIK